MKLFFVGVAAIVALYLYGNHLRKKKTKMIKYSGIKNTYEYVKTDKFTLEDMLKWFKSHNDIKDNDECVLSRVTNEFIKKGGFDTSILGHEELDYDKSLLLIVTNASHRIIKHGRIVTYNDVDKDILDMLGEKQMIILE